MAPTTIAVVGAGVAGLQTAAQLKEAGAGAGRGSWVGSHPTPFADAIGVCAMLCQQCASRLYPPSALVPDHPPAHP